MHIKYEWDEGKRQQNLAKHGVDFEDAARFDWSSAVIDEDMRSEYGERRFIAVGWIGARLHVLIFAVREDAVRVISLHKANARERKRYEQAQRLY